MGNFDSSSESGYWIQQAPMLQQPFATPERQIHHHQEMYNGTAIRTPQQLVSSNPLQKHIQQQQHVSHLHNGTISNGNNEPTTPVSMNSQNQMNWLRSPYLARSISYGGLQTPVGHSNVMEYSPNVFASGTSAYYCPYEYTPPSMSTPQQIYHHHHHHQNQHQHQHHNQHQQEDEEEDQFSSPIALHHQQDQRQAQNVSILASARMLRRATTGSAPQTPWSPTNDAIVAISNGDPYTQTHPQRYLDFSGQSYDMPFQDGVHNTPSAQPKQKKQRLNHSQLQQQFQMPIRPTIKGAAARNAVGKDQFAVSQQYSPSSPTSPLRQSTLGMSVGVNDGKMSFPPPFVVSCLDKIHVCTLCDKRFKRLEHLKRHNKVHTGERRYCCTIPGCGKWFSRTDNLMAHIRTHGKKGGRNRYVPELGSLCTPP